MDLIYFFLDITWVEAIFILFFLSVILIAPIYTRLIGAICFMFCIIFVFFWESELGGENGRTFVWKSLKADNKNSNDKELSLFGDEL
ncbi:hypothetical protein ISI83_001315 [Campylobacter coli]|nr:hypothetical protein [Campylobacter coli]EAI9313865.1 hypothetical protein [Campylobacter coli]EGN5691615.1 hypothetical protein [Campylobacter coli]